MLSMKTRLVLSKYIFRKLNVDNPPTLSELGKKIKLELISEDSQQNWINRIPLLEIDRIRRKIHNHNYSDKLSDHIQNLVKIVAVLINSNESYKINYNPLNIRELVEELVANNITLGMTQLSLEVLIPLIFDYLKKHFIDFKLERNTKQNLIDDGKRKECARCHKIKPYNKFPKFGRKKRIMYVCIKCKSELNAIWQNKKN